MAIEQLHPTGRGFSQIVVATGQKHVFLSGRCAVDNQGRLVGKDDLAAQTDQVMQNIGQALSEVGASFDDLVRMTIYVVDYEPSKRDIMQSVRDRYIAPEAGPASTLIGVSKLVFDEFLIEIEAQAIIDG